MGNWTKVLQHSMSRHNMTNPDKPKLVNYNRKICNRVTAHFTDTITRTSVYSPNYTAYWILNYAMKRSDIGSLSAVKIIFRSRRLAGFPNDNYRDLRTVIFGNWNHFGHFKKIQVYYNVPTS